MPNPLSDNDAAAKFLDFYGSAAMEKQVVNRLYTQGVRRHNMARQQAEATAVPSKPAVRRTPQQINAFVKRAADGEQALRQRRAIEREQQRRLEINPRAPFVKACFETKEEEEKHLAHMYDHQKKRFGFGERSEAIYGEPDEKKVLEQQWRVAMGSPPRADGKALLVHGAPSCPTQRPHLRSTSALVGDDRENYYAQLAEPIRKWSKVPTECGVNTFSVYTKFRGKKEAHHQ